MRAPAGLASVVVHPRHPLTGVCSQPLDKQHHKDGEDEEGEGAPLVQGGEGQGAKEVLRAHRLELHIKHYARQESLFQVSECFSSSGKPRGRPKKAPGEAKPKYVPTGAPRGRKPGQKNSK